MARGREGDGRRSDVVRGPGRRIRFALRLVDEIAPTPACLPSGRGAQRIRGRARRRLVRPRVNVASRLCSVAAGARCLSAKARGGASELRSDGRERRLHWLEERHRAVAARTPSSGSQPVALAADERCPLVPDRGTHVGVPPDESRLTRKEKQARDRSALLSSAAKLICRKASTRHRSTTSAGGRGLYEGGVYANFKNKEEMFLDMLDQAYARSSSASRPIYGRGRPCRGSTCFSRRLHQFRPLRPEWPRLTSSSSSMARATPNSRGVATRNRTMRARIAEVIRNWSATSLGRVTVPVRGHLRWMLFAWPTAS